MPQSKPIAWRSRLRALPAGSSTSSVKEGRSTWHWQYFESQGFANVLQVLTISLAAYSFWIYFIPEQNYKRLEEAKAKLEDEIQKKNSELAQKESNARDLAANIAIATARAELAGRRQVESNKRAELAIEAANVADKRALESNRALQGSRAALVHFRQREHARRLPSLQGYIAATCNMAYFAEHPGFVDCAIKRLNEPQFAFAFSKREMEQATRLLRESAVTIEKTWRQRVQDLHDYERRQLAPCDLLPEGERNSCKARAIGDAQSRYGNIDPVIAGNFVSKQLQSWVDTLLNSPACPRLDIEAPLALPQDWPADCT